VILNDENWFGRAFVKAWVRPWWQAQVGPRPDLRLQL